MGFFDFLTRFWRSGEDRQEEQEEEVLGTFPALYNGMTLDVETADGRHALTGRLSGYTEGDTTLSLERLPGGLSLAVQELGASVVVQGISETMTQFYLRGTVQESTRVVCRLKDVKAKAITEQRHDFRLLLGVPVTMYQSADESRSNPEECVLVDIGAGGACIESEYLHAQEEVLRLKVKLMDYAPMEFLGEVIRVSEFQPGKFRYGFLFAQLKERELTELTRTLYNIQVGNRSTWMRSGAGPGHW